MKKVFSIDQCSRKEYKYLYKLYNAGKENNIHNLSTVQTIPIEFRALLSLGLKFVTTKQPSTKLIQKCVSESLRKISWNVFFKTNPQPQASSDLFNWFISCKKEWKKITNAKGPVCHLQKDLFNESELLTSVKYLINSQMTKCNDIFSTCISNFQLFLHTHELKVIESDKNAGLCIVNVSDYDEEVLRQLNDCSIYHPSTYSQFQLAMIELKDRIKRFDRSLPEKVKLSKLDFQINKPAKFYILPKVHKTFEHFPKGRPISSTFHKNNKYPSKLLDFFLKPCLNQVSDLLIDTQHLLVLLKNLTLDPNKKYMLVTVDVEALYTSLKIQDCKKHCAAAYHKYVESHKENVIISEDKFNELLALSLDYNYVEYENNMYFQHRGIEMGNSASVAIANITVFYEIISLFMDNEDIMLYKRFLDDLFMIVCIDNIECMETWLKNVLSHKYLKFTYEYSPTTVNFLDVNISLNDKNEICTSLYTKPMNKHKYLQASSNHPIHLKNSLFFSQGLRVVRICSSFSDRLSHLMLMYKKFLDRGYNTKVLYQTLTNLCTYSRDNALKPKKSLLQKYLYIHNPELLEKYGIVPTNSTPRHRGAVYLVFPFYSCIPKYPRDIIYLVRKNLTFHCAEQKYRVIVDQMEIKVVFSRTNNLKEELTTKSNKM